MVKIATKGCSNALEWSKLQLRVEEKILVDDFSTKGSVWAVLSLHKASQSGIMYSIYGEITIKSTTDLTLS
jgi:hypothetical protein